MPRDHLNAAEGGGEQMTRLDLPLLLPEILDDRDRCVARLTALLERRDGIGRVHVVLPGELPPGEAVDGDGARVLPAIGPQLCLHYDPHRVTLGQVRTVARLAGAEVSDQFAHAIVPFREVATEDEGSRMEERLIAIPGVTAAAVNFAGQVARIEYDRRLLDAPRLERELRAAGVVRATPAPTPAAPAPAAPAAPTRGPSLAGLGALGGWYAAHRELAWSLGSGMLLGMGWIIERFVVGRPGLHAGVPLVLYAAAYVLGSRDNVGHFLHDLRRGRFRFDIDLLMVVAAVGAAVLGQWEEGALLLFLFSLGHALEHYALGKARGAIAALAELAPQVARIRRPDGTEAAIPIDQVVPGDQVVVRPADRIPVDGQVVEGRSGVNQAPITGESAPVDKVPGDTVFAGSVNGEGSLVVSVRAAVGDRTLDRVIRLVAEAQTQKAPTQQFTERFERLFVPAVLVADLLLILVPPLLGLWTWSEGFYRAMALLVAASPCALALGTPAAVLAGIAQAARNGVLIKGGAHLETMGTISVLALDKTGTITSGEPVVTDLQPTAGTEEALLLTVAAAAEQRSQHPLARAIVRAATARGLALPSTGDLEAVTGRGVRAVVGGDRVEVGRLLMFEDANVTIPLSLRDSVAGLEAAGRSTMAVRRLPRESAPGGPEASPAGWLGVIGVADEPRAGVRETLQRLRTAGIRRLVMLTGDNHGVGESVGRAVGVDEVRAGLLPEDKVAAIRDLAAHGRVAMVGDGVNDAPALAHATVGIAMGGAGTAAALETADVALMGDALDRLPFLIGLSHRARAIIRQNLYISLGVIALLGIATVWGAAGIATAVVVHEGSTLVVIGNALRLLRYRES
ncbi:MAG TPA: heavy metal translocating P-type ATPase [Gemmatimonadaceae bacterium]